MAINTACNGQHNNDNTIDRQPYAAGRYYSSNASELKFQINSFFSKAVARSKEDVIAIISPHAGYPYSGGVAASAFNQINPSKEFDNVFILASSHVKHLNGASIYDIGHYITPMGKVEVNLDLARKLVDEYEFFIFDKEAHQYEHSLEVQLPFLQHIYKEKLKIVPIVLGTQDPEMTKKIAAALRPYFNGRNLFVVSTDFSHYPEYEDACRTDSATAKAVLENKADALLTSMIKNEKEKITNLATSMCGWSSVLSLLHITEKIENMDVYAVDYKNSGDFPFGDKSRVVGYYAIAFNMPPAAKRSNGEFQLTADDKKKLLGIARSSIEHALDAAKNISRPELSENCQQHCGAFVTLHKNGRLRGCIGRFSPDQALPEVVEQMAVAAALQDKRFTPVVGEELNNIDIEISVLTPLEKINSIDEIELGKHGIYIKRGYRSGTFLPQVATETGWDILEFLGHCSRDKAGIGWDGWKDAEIYTYEAIVFGEK